MDLIFERENVYFAIKDLNNFFERVIYGKKLRRQQNADKGAFSMSIGIAIVKTVAIHKIPSPSCRKIFCPLTS